jgi:hypothetical protein
MKKAAISFLFFLISTLSNLAICQSSNFVENLEKEKPGEGKIKLVQDKSISQAFEKFQWEQSKQNGIDGFRIRIFSDSGPNAKAGFDEAKAKFIDIFDNIKIHESFVYPNYKIYVGDFRTRSDALKVLSAMEWQFPDAFIVQTKINFPNLQSE